MENSESQLNVSNGTNNKFNRDKDKQFYREDIKG
jgi:hypothetical protein